MAFGSHFYNLYKDSGVAIRKDISSKNRLHDTARKENGEVLKQTKIPQNPLADHDRNCISGVSLMSGQAHLILFKIYLFKNPGYEKPDNLPPQNSDIWLVVWTFFLFLHILGMSSSQLTFIPSFFRGVGEKPPTRYIVHNPEIMVAQSLVMQLPSGYD